MVLGRLKAMLGAFATCGPHVLWGPRPRVFCSLLRQRNAIVLLTHAAKVTETYDRKLEFRG